MESEVKDGLQLGKMKAESDTLRRCSKYFETCLSERWAQSKSSLPQTEFYLEVQTDIMFYRDCFSRMYFLFKPIPSVAYCIELLKVASQIVFQDVEGLGVKYLSAANWSADEEKLIRDFYQSGHLSLSSASELSARLGELPLSEEEKQKKLSHCAREMLSSYLRHAMPDSSTPGAESRANASDTCPRSRKKFAGAFHAIVSGSGVCNDVLQYALTLVKEETKRLLITIKNALLIERGASASVQRDISNLCWLFKIARRANAAQTIVEVVVEGNELSDAMLEEESIPGDTMNKWARVVICPIFQDVLQ